MLAYTENLKQNRKLKIFYVESGGGVLKEIVTLHARNIDGTICSNYWTSLRHLLNELLSVRRQIIKSYQKSIESNWNENNTIERRLDCFAM